MQLCKAFAKPSAFFLQGSQPVTSFGCCPHRIVRDDAGLVTADGTPDPLRRYGWVVVESVNVSVLE